ncbi:type VI secretion system baseplate subunit TssE [Tundrisphaera sp. TA3]|uniref:type VI secretion system baseplate subunit TssE n=1 Tax=Tundrisphaera sp. TA3 TaxID=3435775 RepID=UPI003EB86BC0
MAPGESPFGLVPSLLDRLIAPDADGTAWRRGFGIEQVRDAIRRDLEDLLNTHRSHPDLPPGFEELINSVFTYGMPDPSSLSAMAQKPGEISRAIAEVIDRFEPRLRDIDVRVVDQPDVHHRRIRFQIEARFRIEPFSDVEFETVLELSSGHTSIEPAGA